jgi:cytochrome c peroxidase
MKRLLRNLLIVALALVVVLCVIYRVVLSGSTPNEELALDARVTAILEDGGCLSCHVAEPELPFYAKFPVVGKLVKQDAQDGYRAFDIAPLMAALEDGAELSVIDVAKVEKVALDKSMPMAKYYFMHWGSQMTDAKASVVAAWARLPYGILQRWS